MLASVVIVVFALPTALAGTTTSAIATVPSKATGVSVATSASTSGPSSQMETLRLLALGVQDSRAVVMLPTRQLIILKPGDTVPGTQAVVKEILPTKLVLEEAGGSVRQLVWLYKAQGNAASRVERFGPEGNPTWGVQAPKVIVIPGNTTNPASSEAHATKQGQ